MLVMSNETSQQCLKSNLKNKKDKKIYAVEFTIQTQIHPVGLDNLQ